MANVEYANRVRLVIRGGRRLLADLNNGQKEFYLFIRCKSPESIYSIDPSNYGKLANGKIVPAYIHFFIHDDNDDCNVVNKKVIEEVSMEIQELFHYQAGSVISKERILVRDKYRLERLQAKWGFKEDMDCLVVRVV